MTPILALLGLLAFSAQADDQEGLRFTTSPRPSPPAEREMAVRIALVADATQAPLGSALQARLGSSYEVRRFGDGGSALATGRLPISELDAYEPSVILVALGSGDAAHWAIERDRFEPAARTALEALRSGVSTRLFVLLPAAGLSDVFDSEVRPLIRQAAREAGAAIAGADAKDEETRLDQLVFTISNPQLEKSHWKVVQFDSQQIDEGPATFAIDGKPDTYWHTQYDPTLAKYPHQITVDLGRAVTVRGFGYLPRQDGGVNGRVKAYEFYVSKDGSTWGSPAAKGTLPDVETETMIKFDHPSVARFFRFVALSEQNGGPWASAAEIDILRGGER